MLKQVTKSKNKPRKELFIKRLCYAAKLHLLREDYEKVLRCLQLIEQTAATAHITNAWKEAEATLDLFNLNIE